MDLLLYAVVVLNICNEYILYKLTLSFELVILSLSIVGYFHFSTKQPCSFSYLIVNFLLFTEKGFVGDAMCAYSENKH